MMLSGILFFLVFGWMVKYGDSAVFNEQERQNIESFIQTTVDCKNVTGLTVAVSKNGETYTAGFGYSDLENNIKVTKSTLMNIGSVSKTLTAILLAKLISKAKSRNDTSMDWKSNLQDIFGHKYQLNGECMSSMTTLEDIMSHRTGLGSADLFLQAGVPKHITRHDIVDNLKYLESVIPFRDMWSYCNICYVLAGYIAEKWGKRTWEELMRDEVFLPLNMTSTTFLNDQTLLEVATPYTKNKKKETIKSDLRLYDILDAFGPAGSVCSTADDMSKLLQIMTSNNYQEELNIDEDIFTAMLKPKSMLSKKTADVYSMRSPPFPVTLDSYGYGMAWFVSRYRGIDYFFHSGGLYGFTALLGYIPSKNVSVFLNSNGETSAAEILGPIMYNIFDTLNGDEPWLNETTICSFPSPWKQKGETSETTQNDTQINIDNMDRFIGNYSDLLYGRFNVSEENGTLNVKFGKLMHGKLSHFSDFTFNLTLFEPLSEVFDPDSFTVSFENFIDNQFLKVRLNKNPSFERLSSNVSSGRRNQPFYLFLYVLVVLHLHNRI